MKEKFQLSSNNNNLSRRCKRCCMMTGVPRIDVPDITIVYAHDGHEWEAHIDKCFHQLFSHINGDQPLHIHSEMLEQMSFPLSPKKIEYVQKSRAQLIIITPEFLDFIHDHCDMLIGQMFDPTHVIAILCGIEIKDIEDIHRAELISFNSWYKMTVIDQDKDFIRKLFCKTTDIMELTEESEVVQNPKFKLTPRKVREGCNKVYALLKSPIHNDEEVKVYVRFSNSPFNEIPFTKKNPYTIQFLVPEAFLVTSQLISIQITCDGISMGIRQLKCETQMGELTHLLNSVIDPMAFLCQTLGYSKHMNKELDILLASSFKKHLPEGLHILQLSKDVQSRKSEEEMPTVLHFAAHYGLKELCSLLLDCPGAKMACNIRNVAGYCPSELAEISGFLDLAQMLENFVNLAVTADLFSIVYNGSNEANRHRIYESLYDCPSSIPLYDSPLSIPVPVPSSSPVEETDYLPMSSSTSSLAYLEPHQRLLLGIDHYHELESSLVEEKPNNVNESETSSYSVNTTANRFPCNTQSQLELLELLEDFKNNKFSLSEVEQLFEEWKLRQSTRSFKEKEEQLAQLRTKYEEIQQVAPDKGKKALSLDKIVSIFVSKVGKKPRMNSSKVDISQNQKMDVLEENEPTNNRPASTFSIASVVSSISSSSSSDRGSTISCMSNYDSGTQSDSGDDHIRSQRIIGDHMERRGSANTISDKQKKLSSTIQAHMISLDPQLPPIPTHARGISPPRSCTQSVAVKPPKKPLTPSPISNTRLIKSNIEERKPLPPPRPDRISASKSPNNEEVSQNVSPDYVTPDQCVYQIPVSPPQNIFDEPFPRSKDGKQPLMPPRQTPKECASLQKSPNYGRPMPDYMNLSKCDVHMLSQKFSKTKHHDYYNWSPSAVKTPDTDVDKNEVQQKFLDPYPRKMNLKIKNSGENADILNQCVETSVSPTAVPKLYNRIPMTGRPLPEVPPKF